MQETEVTVRFCETDALGHINNTSYFIYLEEARMTFFKSLGYSMNIEDWKFIIASTKCDFKSQGYFNQTLTIQTEVSRIGTKSFQIEHTISCAQTKDVIAEGNAVIVYYDFEKQTSAEIPQPLREGLERNLQQLQK